jgi:hypothetical protein
MVPVVGGIMVYLVEVRGRNAKKIELKTIEPHLAQKSGGKQIENRSIGIYVVTLYTFLPPIFVEFTQVHGSLWFTLQNHTKIILTIFLFRILIGCDRVLLADFRVIPPPLAPTGSLVGLG